MNETGPTIEERLITPRELLKVARKRTFDAHRLARMGVEERLGAVTCKKGCAFCCLAKILIDPGQGALLYLLLREDGKWTPALEARLLAADREMTARTHAQWMAEQRPCVFLRGNACQVYGARPLACATTFSVEPDPAACGVPGGRNLVHLHSDEMSLLFALMYRSILDAANVPGGLVMTLPGAVLFGRALIEGLPRPKVRMVNIDGVDSIEEAFDAPEVPWGP